MDKVRGLGRYGTDTPAERLDLPSEQETLEQREQRTLEDHFSNCHKERKKLYFFQMT